MGKVKGENDFRPPTSRQNPQPTPTKLHFYKPGPAGLQLIQKISTVCRDVGGMGKIQGISGFFSHFFHRHAHLHYDH